MKYMCLSRELDDHWYPTSGDRDLKLQGKIDEYLDWHHGGIRMGTGAYFFRTYASGLMSKDGTWSTQESVDEAYELMMKTLSKIEKIWLRADRKSKFMFGSKPSIADLSLGCEITNLLASGYDLGKNYPSINAWYCDGMMSIPSFKKLHEEATPRIKMWFKSVKDLQKMNDVKIIARL